MRHLTLMGLVAIAVLGLAAPAAAHKKSYEASVNVAFAPSPGTEGSVAAQGTFSGTVVSGGGCSADRGVVVQSSRQDVERTNTDATGLYSLTNFAFTSDNPYRAVAIATTIKKGKKHKHKCLEAVSAPVDVAF